MNTELLKEKTVLFDFSRLIVNDYIYYLNCTNEAYYHFFNGNYIKAKKYFNKAFVLGLENQKVDEYYFAKTLSETGDTTYCILKLENNIYSRFIINDSSYFRNISVSTKKRLNEKGKIILKQTIEETEKDTIYQVLKKHNILDQQYRKYLQDSINILSKNDTVLARKLKDSIFVLDRLNLKIMDSIFHLKGFYLEKDNVTISHPVVHIFLLHQSIEWYLNNDEYLKAQIRKGFLSPYSYAAGYDRLVANYLLGKEFYGRYIVSDPNITAKQYFKRQTSIGISPYFEKMKAVVKKGETPKKSKFYDTYKKRKYLYNSLRD